MVGGPAQAVRRCGAGDRLFACWLLSLLGLRRGEVLGLSGVTSRSRATVTICRSRVLVDGKIIDKSPKSRRSAGTCRCSSRSRPCLEALYALQGTEKDSAGRLTRRGRQQLHRRR